MSTMARAGPVCISGLTRARLGGLRTLLGNCFRGYVGETAAEGFAEFLFGYFESGHIVVHEVARKDASLIL